MWRYIRTEAGEPAELAIPAFVYLLFIQGKSGKLRQIERMVQVPFHKVEIPTGKDVCRKQFFHFMEKLLHADISHGDYETYVPMLEEKFADVSKEEILKRVAAQGILPVS